MISYSRPDGGAYWDIRGRSTDEKPVDNDIPNGSTYTEINTAAVFMWDKEYKTWCPM